MKKSIIAMAVAGALAVPAIASADATLYGTVAVDGVFKNDTSADIQVDDAIIGLKGNVDLGVEGVTGFFNIRTELSAEGGNALSEGGSTLKTDRAFVGVTGGFGTVLAGTIANPVDDVESLDSFADSYSTDNYFITPSDLQSAAAYVTPAMGGFTGYVGIVMEGGDVDGTVANASGDDKDLDGYVLGFNYSIGGLSADLGYWKFEEESNTGTTATGDFDFVGLSLDYSINDSWSVAMNWSESDNEQSGSETELWGLGTSYTIGNTTLGLQYLDFDDETNGVKGGATGNEWGVTASHALGNRAKVYAQYSDAEVDAGSVAGERVFNVGYSISF